MQSATQLDSSRFQSEQQVRSRILVVDDVPTNRSVLVSLLSSPECQVIEASNGDQALEIIADTPLDLVILDILMPGLSGMQVLERVRKSYSSSELPILMLTIKDDIDDVVKALESGANDYVTRPFDYTVLTTRINALVAYKQTQDSIREAHSKLESRIAERTNELVQANRALQTEVTERKLAEEQVRISQERYRALYNDTPSMFFSLGSDDRIMSANRFGADSLGYSIDSIVGKSILDLHIEGDQQLILDKINECRRRPERVHRWDACMLNADASRIWVRTAARVLPGDAQNDNSILMVCEDISETRSLSEQLKYQAKHDALTGLINRYEFEHRLKNLLDDARRNRNRHALLYMDLDHFKVINDTCGHDAGDELLRQLGRILKEQTAGTDTLARLGGDEFAMLLSNCDLDRATSVANDLHRVINEFRFVWRDARFGISVSIGVVAIEHTTEDIATLMSAADTACYSAKEEGPKHVHVYQPDDEEVIRRYREMNWIAKIDKALEEERFELYYQRIIPIRPAELESSENGDHYELLLRMRDERGRIVQPASFLPAAERYKYATKLDRWVVEYAFNWLAATPDRLGQLSICSINLSGHSISDNEFLGYVLDQLEKYSIPPGKLCFELTETATITNLASASGLIAELRNRGCLFALDDFGTGLSSFEYLKNLPVDFIKIDGQFIRNIVSDSVNYTMVKSINDIAKVMSKKTIAEFVDTEAALTTLREIGIDYAQGNIVARATPLSTLTARESIRPTRP
jgi:diguanylate cyclase (GGDEF)-like protein/PAS domain S-box-containing protein